MKIKTSELTGAALDWAVANALGDDYLPTTVYDALGREYPPTRYSTDWSQGGPIIERESITLRTNACVTGHWAAFIDFGSSNTNIKARQSGPTSLIAAMRCFVASRFGEEMDIPEELLS